MEEIKAYKTKDGEVFTDKSEAEMHEEVCVELEPFDEFIEEFTRNYSISNAVVLMNGIRHWEKFKRLKKTRHDKINGN